MSQYMDHFIKEKVLQTTELKLQDELIFGLRLTKGINIAYLESKYNINLFEKYPQLTDKINIGLVDIHDGNLRLTKEGVMLGNQVFMLFV